MKSNQLRAIGTLISDATGRAIANIAIARLNMGACEKIARRLVASWNACIGISTESLEQIGKGATLTGLVELTKRLGVECDDLVHGLQDYYAADARYSDLHDGMDGAEQAAIMMNWQTARGNVLKLLEKYAKDCPHA